MRGGKEAKQRGKKGNKGKQGERRGKKGKEGETRGNKRKQGEREDDFNKILRLPEGKIIEQVLNLLTGRKKKK